MIDLKEHFRHVFEELNLLLVMNVYLSRDDMEYLDNQVIKLTEEIQLIKDRASGKKPLASKEEQDEYLKKQEEKEGKGILFEDE